MTILRNVLRDLLDKRLWPVAAALGAGIIAATVLLATSMGGGKAAPAGAPTPAAAGVPAAGGLTGVVSAAQESELGDEERSVVGKTKDPFRPTAQAGAAEDLARRALAAAGSAAPGAPAAPAVPAGGGEPPVATGSAPGTASAPAPAGTSTAPARPEEPVRSGETYTFYEADVRISHHGGKKGRLRTDVARLTPMPTAKRPVLLYFGVFNGGTSAGFLVNRLATTKSSTCADVPGHCSLLRLKEGSSATVKAPGGDGRTRTYTLTVKEIRKVVTRDRDRAVAARSRLSNAGACLLARGGEDYGTLMFDADSGSYIAGGKPAKCTAKGSAKGGSRGFLPDLRGAVFR